MRIWFIVLWLVFETVLQNKYAASLGIDQYQCLTHDDCTDSAHFCAWTTCNSTKSFSCSECKPCTLCTCDSDSIDFQCPQKQCPGQPYSSVRFVQGEFYNFSNLQLQGYTCLRRFLVSGNIFSLSQLPIFTQHPATVATFDESVPLSVLCPAYVRSGIFVPSKTPDTTFQAVVSSEGTPQLHIQYQRSLIGLTPKASCPSNGRPSATARTASCSQPQRAPSSSTARPSPTKAGTPGSSSSKVPPRRRRTPPATAPPTPRRASPRGTCPLGRRAARPSWSSTAPRPPPRCPRTSASTSSRAPPPPSAGGRCGAGPVASFGGLVGRDRGDSAGPG